MIFIKTTAAHIASATIFSLVLFLCTMAPSLAYVYVGEDGVLVLSQPIKSTERSRLRTLRIKHAHIYGGADPDIFNDKKDFPILERITIDVDDPSLGNVDPSISPDPNFFTQLPKGPLFPAEHYLFDIKQNFSTISFITVRQKQPLSKLACDNIKSLKELRNLELICPLDEVNSFQQCLSSKIVYLRIGANISLPPLPKLHALYLEGFTVNPQLLNDLKAASLKELHCQNCEIFEGSLDGIKKFRNLKLLDLSTSSAESLRMWKLFRRRQSFQIRFPNRDLKLQYQP